MTMRWVWFFGLVVAATIAARPVSAEVIVVKPSAVTPVNTLYPSALGGGGGSASCTVTNATLDFGTYNVFSGAPVAAMTSIDVSCSFTNSINATLTFSTGSSGSYATRTMLSGGPNPLNYNIYADSGHTQILGDGTSGTWYYYLVGTGRGRTTASWTVPAHGQVPSSQTSATPGTYTDTITVTVSY